MSNSFRNGAKQRSPRASTVLRHARICSIPSAFERAVSKIVVNASRGVLYASQGADWQTAAREAATALRTQLEAARQEAAGAADRAATR